MNTSKQDKKRFLFIIGRTCPFPGAGWWRTFHLAKNFAKKGHDCYILSSISARCIQSSKVINEENIPIYNMVPAVRYDALPVTALDNFLALIVLFPFLLRIRPRFIIISVPPIDQFFSTFILAKIMKIHIIADYRDEFEDYSTMHSKFAKPFYRFLKRFLVPVYKSCDLIAPVTPAVALSLNERGIRNIKVVWDGVDTTVFKPSNKNDSKRALDIPEDSFVIAFLGTIYDPYRVDLVVKAIHELNRSEDKYQLIIIGGSGGTLQGVLKLADILGVRSAVRDLGVSKDPVEIAKLLSSADCGVVPYDSNPLWEKTYSTKLFEYCAIGLPVVATVTENSALSKLIKERRIGLVVPPLDVKALVKSFDRLKNDQNLQALTSSNALLFARAYDRETIAADFLKSLIEL